MVTRTIRVHRDRPEPDAIGEAVRVLSRGGLVAFPTETVYGLGARALDREALARIFAAKGRPVAHPLIAHVADVTGARALAAEWNDHATKLAAAFWPGPLTLVVPRAASVPAEVSGGGPSIAVRAPAHPVARALLAALGEPIAAPSANRYQSVSPTCAEHVLRSLDGLIDLVLDAGACDEGIESTVVDVRHASPRVLRPGGIDLVSLRRIVPETTVDDATTAPEESAARASPGMDARHYAPRAELVLVPDEKELRTLALAAKAAGKRVGAVVRGHAPEDLVTAAVIVYALPDDAPGFGTRLFATLHALDDARVEVAFVLAVPGGEAWRAVRDRLGRAARRS
jgi:L-threonylcarbamoyladenylate synthase